MIILRTLALKGENIINVIQNNSYLIKILIMYLGTLKNRKKRHEKRT